METATKKRNQIEGTEQTREIRFDRSAIDKKNRTIEIAFSSEVEVERYWGTEVLDHEPSSVRLGRLNSGAPLLMDHNHRDQVGVIETASIGGDKKGRALIRFGPSERAEEIWQDVLADIRTKVSVGYLIHKVVTTEEKDEPVIERVMDWEPFEVSMVSIPADNTVGVGRSADENKIKRKGHDMNENVETQEEMSTRIHKEIREKDAEKVRLKKDADAEAQEQVRVGEEIAKNELERIREITAMGDRGEQKEAAQDAIQSGMSSDKFARQLFDKFIENEKTRKVDTSQNLGLTAKEVNQFSFTRALLSIADHNDLRKAPFELECTQALQKQYGKDNGSRSFCIPPEVQRQQRDLNVTNVTAGGDFVATELMASSFIDLLRNNMMVRQMGATILDGLVGNIAIPRQTAGATAAWVAENVAVAETEQTIDQVTLSPESAGTYTDISRRLLLQSSVGVENFVRNDLALALALLIDFAAIYGAGTSNVPEGILNVTGIGDVEAGAPDGAAPVWADIVDLETAVAIDNANIGNLGYLMNSATVGKLKKTEKTATTGVYLMDGKNQNGFLELNGYKAGVSNQVPSTITKGASGAVLSAMIFGNWADLVLGQWGSVDVLVDPYTGGAAGTLRIRIMQDMNVTVRHPESFSAMQDIVTV